MRLTLAIIVAASGGLALMFLLTGGDAGGTPDLLRRKTGDAALGPRKSSGDAVDFDNARGSDIYSPQVRTKTLANDEEVSWTALHVWCGQFDAEEGERFQFKDLRVLANPAPKSKVDVAAHLVVPAELPASAIGDHLLRAIETDATGLRAGTAVFIGGRDLATARRIELGDGVTAWLADPADKTRRVKIESTTLVAEVEDGEIVRGTTDDVVTITAAEGVVSGSGLILDVKTGEIVLEKDINGTLRNLSFVGRNGPEAKIVASGPLRYRPADPIKKGKNFSRAGELTLVGDIVLTQGTYELRGQRFAITTNRPGAAKTVQGFVLEDAVSALLPQGTFFGDRITYTAGKQKGGAKLVLDGAPVRAVLADAGRMLPGVGAKGDLTLTTDGTIVFDRMDADDAIREVVVGPQIAITGQDTHVDAEMLKLFLHRVTSNRAGANDGDRDTFPARIELTGGVRGNGPTGSFSGRQLIYTRSFDDLGRPMEDRVLITGSPHIVYLPAQKTKAGKKLPDPKATSSNGDVDSVLGSTGPLSIDARDSLLVVTHPLNDKPTRAEARGAVVVTRFDRDDPSRINGRLEGKEVDLDLVETFRADIGGGGADVGFLTSRRVKKAAARGNIILVVPERFRGEGDTLSYDGRTGDLTLVRTTPGKPASAVITDTSNRKQTLRAPTIAYRRHAKSIEARGGAQATLMVPPLAYGTGLDRTPVETKVSADSVTAWFHDVVVGKEKTARRIQELAAEGSVDVQQGTSAGLKCSYLRLDAEQEETLIRGTPARLDWKRIQGKSDYPEWIVAPAITLTGGKALLLGPVEARFHSESGKLAMRVGDASRSKRGAPAADRKLVPIDITAAKDLYLSEERVQARGPTTIIQGDPAVDGFRLEGARVVLFLVPGDPGTQARRRDRVRTLEVVRTVVETGAKFRSPDLAADGDVLEFDDREKVITLYSWTGNADLTWRGRHHTQRPRFDLDLSDPDNPIVISVLKPPSRGKR
ncbi:MAG: hypothetical protein CMJ83_17400 [Planctomycetes bacterium]|nr:hypothetical protein [Planctomycetota bacterium]